MKDFALAPFEFLGSGLSPKAHAETRLEIGGKKRNFVIKLHEGVLYFKEPSRGQIFAVLQLFDANLTRDPIGLVSTWQREVGAGNYGAFVAKREFFAKLPVRGQFLMIVKSDGSGWMKEHFDTEWFSLPLLESPPKSNLWDEKTVESQIGELLPCLKASLLQRTISPEMRQSDEPRFLGSDQNSFLLLVNAATRLFLANTHVHAAASLKLKSHSTFAKGEVEGYWLKNAQREPRFAAFWKVLEREMPFVGVRWSEGGEQDQPYAPPRAVRFFEAGLEQWGENWRGNWAPQRGSLGFEIDDFTHCSAHEKLEAALKAREFLKGKMAESEIESLLQSCMGN
ncbi:MAG TPA: hypothetical protein VGB45_15755 [Abditibacterium sp.]